MKEKLKTVGKKIWIALGVAIVLLAILVGIWASRRNEETVANANQDQKNATNQPEMTPDVKEAEVKKEENDEIYTLVEEYFAACLSGDITKLQTLISESEVIEEDILKKKYEYVEAINNIECYSIDGPDDGASIVYVSYDMKFKEIETAAPGIVRFYVTENADGKLVIILSQLDEYTQSVMERSEENKEIIALKNTVDVKFDEALAKDEQLKEFVQKLEESAQQVQESASAESTEKPKEEDKDSDKATSTPEAENTSVPKE